MILGIDEVGRGAWAGPLVVGAVVLGGEVIDGLTDSKVLTKRQREALYEEIYAKAAGIGLGWVPADEIDAIGLGSALRVATKRAVQAVDCSFHEVIIDGTINFLSGTPLENHVATIKKADLLIPSVSAASIVAKVARDRYMAEQAEPYPDYGFASHVGYGTAMHRAAIDAHGVTVLHRLSIAPLAKYASIPKVEPAARKTAITSRKLGDASEQVAAQSLEADGHEVIERNWKTKWCEVDIITKKGGKYYFVEVKHRKSDTAGDGFAAITPTKLRKMTFAAELYAKKMDLYAYERQLMAVATAGDPPVVLDILAIT